MKIERINISLEQIQESILAALWGDQHQRGVDFEDCANKARELAEKVVADHDPAVQFARNQGAWFRVAEDLVVTNNRSEVILTIDGGDATSLDVDSALELANILQTWASAYLNAK